MSFKDVLAQYATLGKSATELKADKLAVRSKEKQNKLDPRNEYADLNAYSSSVGSNNISMDDSKFFSEKNQREYVESRAADTLADTTAWTNTNDDSITGGFTNVIAAGVEGTDKFFGELSAREETARGQRGLTAVNNLDEEALQVLSMPENEKADRNAYKQELLDKQSSGVLNQREQGNLDNINRVDEYNDTKQTFTGLDRAADVSGFLPGGVPGKQNNKAASTEELTPRELTNKTLADFRKANKKVADFTASTKGIYNRRINAKDLDEDLSESGSNFDANIKVAEKELVKGNYAEFLGLSLEAVVEGVADIGADVVTNPAASIEMFAESISEMLDALTAGQGTFSRTVRESVAYIVEKEGRLPNKGETSTLTTAALANAGLTLASAGALGAATRAGTKLLNKTPKIKKKVSIPFDPESPDSPDLRSKVEIGRDNLNSKIREVAEPLAAEAVIEAGQSTLEDKVAKSEDFTGGDVLKAAGQGLAGAAGGVAVGAVAPAAKGAVKAGIATKNLTKAVAQVYKEANSKRKAAKATFEVEQAYGQAYAARSADGLPKAGDADYNPVSEAQVLSEVSKRDDVSYEDKLKNVVTVMKSGFALDNEAVTLNNEKVALGEEYANTDTPPTETRTTEIAERIANIDLAIESNKARSAEIKTLAADIQLNAVVKDAELKAAKAAADAARTEANPEAYQEAANRVAGMAISNSRLSPDSLSAADAQGILDSTREAISDNQIKELESYILYSRSTVNLKNASKIMTNSGTVVNEDGSTQDFKGTNAYIAEAALAVENGTNNSKSISEFESWAAYQQKKSDLATGIIARSKTQKTNQLELTDAEKEGLNLYGLTYERTNKFQPLALAIADDSVAINAALAHVKNIIATGKTTAPVVNEAVETTAPTEPEVIDEGPDLNDLDDTANQEAENFDLYESLDPDLFFNLESEAPQKLNKEDGNTFAKSVEINERLGLIPEATEDTVKESGSIVYSSARTTKLLNLLKTESTGLYGSLVDRIMNRLPKDLAIIEVNSVTSPEYALIPDNLENTGAMFDGNSNNLIINTVPDQDRSKGQRARIRMHELLHAATMNLTRVFSYPNATEKQSEIVLQLEALLGEAKTAYKAYGSKDADVAYGLLDIDEFIAVGLTEPKMQAFLKTVKLGKEQTLFSKFVSAVASILGAKPDDALFQLINLTDQLLESKGDVSANTAVQNAQNPSTVDYDYELDPEGRLLDQDVLPDDQMVPPLTPQEEKDGFAFVFEDGQNTAIRNGQKLYEIVDRFSGDKYFSWVNPENANTGAYKLVRGTKAELRVKVSQISKESLWATEATKPYENKLSDLTGKELSEAFFSRNWLREFFTPRKSKTSVVTDPELFDKALAKGTKEDTVVFAGLVELNKLIKENIEGLLSIPKDSFKNVDPVSYFYTDGVADPVLVNAITVAIHKYLTQSATGDLRTEDNFINQFFGRSKSSAVRYKHAELLRKAGMSYGGLIDNLGKESFNLLGLDMLDHGPVYGVDTMITSIGQLAVAAMTKSGLLVERVITDAQIKAVNSGVNPSDTISSSFLRVPTQVGTSSYGTEVEIPSGNTSQYIEDTKLAPGFYDRVFKSETASPMPTLEPVESKTNVRGTDIQVSPKVLAMQNKRNQDEYFIKNEELDLFGKLSVETRMLMTEFQPDITGLHIENRDGAEGKNEGILRQLNNLTDWVAHLKNKTGNTNSPFFLEMTSQLQGRMGYKGAMSPQANKIVRRFMTSKEWESTVDRTNPEHMNLFNLAIAQAFELENNIPALEKMLKEPVIRKAVTALKNLDNMTPENLLKVEDAIAYGMDNLGVEGPQYLVALINLAKARPTKGGKDTFNSTILLEIDGKTNGLAIGLLEFGGGATAKDLLEALNRTGMYGKGDVTTYTEWAKNAGNLDSYERLMDNWFKSVTLKLDGAPAKMQEEFHSALRTLTGDAETVVDGVVTAKGRKLVKNKLLISIFGASDKKIMSDMAEDFFVSYYKQMEAAVKSKNAVEVKRILDQGAKVAGMPMHNVAPNNFARLLEERISPVVMEAVEDNLTGAFGETLIEAMDYDYGRFKDNRKALNQVAADITTVYNTAVKFAIKDLRARKKTAGTLVERYGVTKAEMQKIEKDLMDIRPAYKGVHGEDGNVGLDSDSMFQDKVPASKASKNVNITKEGIPDRQLKQTYKFNPFLNAKGVTNSANTSKERRVMTKVVGEASVKIPIGLIHNKDSSTRFDVLNTMNVLNNHDADATSVLNGYVVTEMSNASHINQAKSHNIIETVLDVYKRSREYVKKDTRNRYQRKTDKNPNGLPFEVTEKTLPALEKALQVKKETLPLIKHVGQYAIEGKSHTVQNNQAGAPNNPNLDTTQFAGVTPTTLNAANVEVVFDGLKTEGTIVDSAAHSDHLKGVVSFLKNGIVTDFKLHKKFSSAVETMGATDMSDIFLVNQLHLANSSPSLTNGLRMSSQEAFAHELMYALINSAVKVSNDTRNRIKYLYDVVGQKIDVKALMADPLLVESDPTYTAELAAAQSRYNRLFKGSDLDSQLAEFVSLAATNDKFRDVLNSISLTPEIAKFEYGSYADFVFSVIRFAYNALSNRMNGRQNKAVAAQLDTLGMITSGLIAESNSRLISKLDTTVDFTSNVNSVADKGITTATLKLASAIQTIGGKTKATNLLGNITKLALNESRAADTFDTLFKQVRAKLNSGRQGMAATLVGELMGKTADVTAYYKLNRESSQKTEQQAIHISNTTGTALIGSFITPPTESESAALTQMLRADTSALSGTYDYNEIQEFFSDELTLRNEIKNKENDIRSNYGSLAEFYINNGYDLAVNMITGMTVEGSHLLRNAHNIAYEAGTDNVGKNTAVTDQTIKDIDVLISLRAMLEMPQHQRATLSGLLTKELAIENGVPTRTDNGITFTLGLHSNFKRDSLAQVFDGKPYQVVKGYTKDILNPKKVMRIAPGSKEAELKAQGFKRQNNTPVARDPLDPTGENQYVYVSNHGEMTTYQKQIMSLTSLKKEGTDLIKARENLGDANPVVAGIVDKASVLRNKKATINALYAPRRGVPKRSPAYVPTIKNDGSVSAYRYLMQSNTKDHVLDRNNEFEAVLGGMVSSTSSKVETVKINNEAVELLRQTYTEQYTLRSSEFISVGPNSVDPELQAMYAMLPQSTKDHIKAIWGGNDMQVRADVLTIMFGYRKVSIADSFNNYLVSKAEMDRNVMNQFERVALNIVDKLIANDVTGKMSTAGDAWTETMKEVKSFIVVKSGVVTAGNILSNMILLWTMGVPVHKVIQYQYEGAQFAVDHQKRVVELDTLKMQKEVYGANTKRDNRIRVLEDDAKNSPIKDLVDGGVMQSIVEDVDLNQSNFSYKSSLTKGIEEYTSKMPDIVTNTGKLFYMTQDTKMFKILNNAVRLSDFVARYALHKHNTVDSKTPMSVADSIEDIMFVFIDYDVPTDKRLQYANDIGVVWFSKYNMRVQRIILRSLKDNPSRALAVLLAQKMFFGVSDITDSLFFLNKSPLDTFGNPLQNVGSLGDSLTLNLAQSVF